MPAFSAYIVYNIEPWQLCRWKFLIARFRGIQNEKQAMLEHRFSIVYVKSIDAFDILLFQ